MFTGFVAIFIFPTVKDGILTPGLLFVNIFIRFFRIFYLFLFLYIIV